MLVELSKRGVKIIGLNYKDQESLAGDWLTIREIHIFSILILMVNWVLIWAYMGRQKLIW